MGKYTPPVGGGANDSFVDENPALGVDGSAVPAAAIEWPQRELDHLITEAGLAPSTGDLTQVYQAILALIAAAAPDLTGYASLDLPQAWTKAQWTDPVALDDAATIAWNVEVAQVAEVTITADRILGLPTNRHNGYFSLYVIQGAGGNHHLAYNAVFKGITGVTLSTAAGAKDHLVFRDNGTTLDLVSFAKNVGA